MTREEPRSEFCGPTALRGRWHLRAAHVVAVGGQIGGQNVSAAGSVNSSQRSSLKGIDLTVAVGLLAALRTSLAHDKRVVRRAGRRVVLMPQARLGCSHMVPAGRGRMKNGAAGGLGGKSVLFVAVGLAARSIVLARVGRMKNGSSGRLAG